MAVLLASVCIGFQILSMKLVFSAGTELELELILGGCCTEDEVALPGISLSIFAACTRPVD